MPTNEESYFLAAERCSKNATCPRASVGCVVVLQNGKLLRAHNGAMEGLQTCNEVGCLMEGGHCVRAMHAEVRLVALAALSGTRLEGATAFTTLLPCVNCMQALATAGVRTIYFDRSYEREEREHLFKLAKQSGVRLIERTRS